MRKKTGAIDLTTGNEMRAIVVFALPLIAGNLFQQLYNLMDTMIVGKFIGADALAAVGSSYMTMNFLTSIIIGLCMGSGIVFSWFYGSRQREKLEQSMFQSFLFILAVTVMITGASLLFLDQLLHLLNIESSIFQMTRAYLFIIICGMGFVFLYNYFTAVLRSMGNSFTPLIFLNWRMRRVIVNSTPIIVLCNIGLLDILKALYAEICIPEAVYREVTEKDDSACQVLKTALNWIHVEKIANQSDKKMYKAKLHDGEVEVMILAQEGTADDLVVIDDNAAKKTAKYLGLKVTGTIGVLLKAKREGIIPEIASVLEKMKKNGFYISESLEQLVLEQAGEQHDI